MAQQTATARSSSQGKGRKAKVAASMLSPRAARPRLKSGSNLKRARVAKAAGSQVRHLDTVVQVGTAITFAPTGERLRVTKIERGRITFEKLP